ncbi:hypothetical protein BV25DRAFT_1826230, partial [Artomyces pyxidatus]
MSESAQHSASIIILPFDVHAAILEWVYRQGHYDGGGDGGRKTLGAAALVCTAWTSIAQRLLFRELPSIFSAQAASNLVALFHAKPALGSYIRRLSISVIPCLQRHSPITFTQFVAIFSYCRGIESLHLMCELENELTPSELEQIRALDLHITVLSCHTITREIFQIATLWPIQYMVCGMDRQYGRPPGYTLPGDRAPFSLRGLILKNHVNTSLVPWLLPADPRSPLQELEINELLEEDPYHILPHAPTIRSLVLNTSPTQSVLSRFTGLEEYCIRYYSRKPLRLPPKVWHIGLHGPGSIVIGSERQYTRELQSTLDIISNTPALRLVTAHALMNRKMTEALGAKCREMGVEFRRYLNPDLLPV